MAASITGLLKPWTTRVFLVRWSRYNPYYLEPEPRKEVYHIPETELTPEQKEERELKSTLEDMKRKQVEKYHKAPKGKKAEVECNPYAIFHQALENCKPVPIPLTGNRRRFLAMKWMITECRDNKHRRTLMYEKLSQELLAAFSKEGNVVKRKHELHKMAESNRAYAHYRWW
ncbi:unnamed protein product [Coregonus sp. 'balchen']|nr:unnamed protein product [Coregonus sp. 'balchen']